MQTSTVFLTLLALCALSFFVGRHRSRLLGMAGGGLTTLNSLPKHYGYMAALWAGLPAFLLFVVWLALESSILQNMIVSGLPAEVQALSDSELGLYYNQLVGYAQGSVDISRVSEAQVAAAAEYQELAANSKLMKLLLVGSLALLGGLLATIRVSPELRARSHVENIFKWILLPVLSLPCSLLWVLFCRCCSRPSASFK